MNNKATIEQISQEITYLNIESTETSEVDTYYDFSDINIASLSSEEQRKLIHLYSELMDIDEDAFEWTRIIPAALLGTPFANKKGADLLLELYAQEDFNHGLINSLNLNNWNNENLELVQENLNVVLCEHIDFLFNKENLTSDKVKEIVESVAIYDFISSVVYHKLPQLPEDKDAQAREYGCFINVMLNQLPNNTLQFIVNNPEYNAVFKNIFRNVYTENYTVQKTMENSISREKKQPICYSPSSLLSSMQISASKVDILGLSPEHRLTDEIIEKSHEALVDENLPDGEHHVSLIAQGESDPSKAFNFYTNLKKRHNDILIAGLETEQDIEKWSNKIDVILNKNPNAKITHLTIAIHGSEHGMSLYNPSYEGLEVINVSNFEKIISKLSPDKDGNIHIFLGSCNGAEKNPYTNKSTLDLITNLTREVRKNLPGDVHIYGYQTAISSFSEVSSLHGEYIFNNLDIELLQKLNKNKLDEIDIRPTHVIITQSKNIKETDSQKSENDLGTVYTRQGDLTIFTKSDFQHGIFDSNISSASYQDKS